ncbi:MAG TPA: GntR family transcriptional regulator [Trebonia sp.]|nr:GntR family transcriptional regulator [Trebonia sp.]
MNTSPSSASIPGPVTRFTWAERKLKDAIIRGELKPGDKVLVAKLAQDWKCSPTPLREALSALAAAGFVEAVPQRGARVAAVSPEDARQVYELRILLEPMALADSLARADEDYRAGVSRSFDGFRMVAGSTQPGLVQFEAHRAFHDATYARCSSDWLCRLIGLLADSSARYTAQLGEHDEVAEHQRIHDAILAGDSAAAVTALSAHLQPRLDWALEQLAQASNES